MKPIKIILSILVISTLFFSCSTEDDYINVPEITLRELLESYELWYVDIESASGIEIPFLQKAFTISFNGGRLFANNNLVGIGTQGNGFGIDVGNYTPFETEVDINHVIDGPYTFEVRQLSNDEIELYYRPTQTTYVLVGFQRSNFDYDLLFYNNIHYFLQEYVAWEKTGTFGGEANPFDYENFLQFLPGGGTGNFKSSQDEVGTNIGSLIWDFVGIYNVDDIENEDYLKILTLDYDFFDNEYFELSVIDDNTIELYQTTSKTTYEFKGKGFIQFKRADTKRLSKAKIAKQMVNIKN